MDEPERRLDQAHEAFERGDFLSARQLAAGTLAELDRHPKDNADADEARARAERLLQQIRPDPLVKYLLAVSAVLLVLLTLFAYSHSLHP